jgi:uncharacterized LabA/DUF88 family protein
MATVAVFLDFANISASSNSLKCKVDYGSLLEYLADPNEGRFLQAAFAYVPIDPRLEHAMDRTIKTLWKNGYVVKSKVGTIAGQTYKCDFDVEMTLGMVKTAFDSKPDIIVLVSGDSDFVPVVLELRDKCIRVEVASFENSMSALLSCRCSGFINLNTLMNDKYSAEGDEAVNDFNDSDNETQEVDSEVQEVADETQGVAANQDNIEDNR